MSRLVSSPLAGVWGTVLLPLAPDDAIDWERTQAEIEFLASGDLDGVYAHGTAGEFHTLTEDEFDDVNDLLAGACARHGKPFQIGASHPVAQTSLARVRRAVQHAPTAVQVVLPGWIAVAESEAIAFLDRLSVAAGPVPLVLYHPGAARTVLTPEALGRIVRAVPGIVGLKVPGGDDEWFARARTALGDCAIFVPGHRLASGIARGARGSYSNIAALSPAGAVAWYRLMQADPAAGLDVERRIAEFFAAHIEPLAALGYSDPALDKFLAAVGGWGDVGLRVRWPWNAVPEEAVPPAREAAQRLLPELFPTG